MKRTTIQVLRHSITSVDGIRQAVASSNFEVDQLSSDAVIGKKMFADIGGVVLSSGRFSGDIRAKGVFSSRDLSFGILLEEGSGCRHWFREARQDDTGIFPAGDEHDAIYHSHASYAAVSLPEDRLLAFADKEKLRLPANALRSTAILKRCTDIGQTLREALPTLESAQPPHVSFGAEIRDRLLMAFILRLREADGLPSLPRIARPERIVQEAIAYLQRNRQRPVTVHELASTLSVPRRSLERAFISVTSYPPATYLRVHRLNAVRRTLLSSPADAIKPVSHAALYWGFTHLGRFSAQYRLLFGELPRTTVLERADVERHRSSSRAGFLGT